MGIGPGGDCGFNTLTLGDFIVPGLASDDDQNYLNAVSGSLFPSQVNAESFENLTIDINNRRFTADRLARVIKQDITSSANSNPSCNQFDEISQNNTATRDQEATFGVLQNAVINLGTGGLLFQSEANGGFVQMAALGFNLDGYTQIAGQNNFTGDGSLIDKRSFGDILVRTLI